MRHFVRQPTAHAVHLQEFRVDLPASTVTAAGLRAAPAEMALVFDDGDCDLEPYHAPSLDEVCGQPPNGYTAISTFSGCGGSSMGYRLAGFDVRWANEFLPEVARCYSHNLKGTHVNTSDIRDVTPEQVLEEAQLNPGELDLMDGSPPCSSFSTVGIRDKGWGQVHSYSSTAQRTDDLFWEYARLLRGLQPKVFVAENVKGLVMGKAQGYFKQISALLTDCGYQVQAAVVDASLCGVPQRRERVIFIGTRNDLGVPPSHPIPVSGRPRAIGACLGRNLTEEQDPTARPIDPVELTYIKTRKGRRYLPCKLLDGRVVPLAVLWDEVGRDVPLRMLGISEVKRICSFPDDYDLDTPSRNVKSTVCLQRKWQWERLGRSVPPVMMQRIATHLRDNILDRCGR